MIKIEDLELATEYKNRLINMKIFQKDLRDGYIYCNFGSYKTYLDMSLPEVKALFVEALNKQEEHLKTTLYNLGVEI